jgi:hypothetical protein
MIFYYVFRFDITPELHTLGFHEADMIY